MNKKDEKINLGYETVCSVMTEKAVETFHKVLILKHPKFSEIKLIVTINPKGHFNYANESVAIFCDIVQSLFNGLTELDFMVVGTSDALEYSYYSTKQVLSYLLAEACEYMASENLRKFSKYKPYLISSTMILTDGVTASIGSIGDDKCYIKENGTIDIVDCSINSSYIGKPNIYQISPITLDYSSIQELYVLNYELDFLMQNKQLESFLKRDSRYKLSEILFKAFLFPRDSKKIPCTLLGLYKNKRRTYQK